MLAKKRGFHRNGKEIIRTPLLLPSFSSKGFPEVKNILKITKEFIDGEILVSAYDIFYNHIDVDFDFAEAIFLDSGGYEASLDIELSDISKTADYSHQNWSMENYNKVISEWKSSRPTVIISYDNLNHRIPLVEQIKVANQSLPPHGENIFREILLKPEKDGQEQLNIGEIVKHIHKLEPFDAIGMTEKEVGNSLANRMENIAKVRNALIKSGLGDRPIHIFGSLDTISTPLYFLAGADIFDGLTWLRFSYYKGFAIYRQNFVALDYGPDTRSTLVDPYCSSRNYHYLVSLENEMRIFLNSRTFSSFKYHNELFESTYNALIEKIEGY